ncbi:DUF881 domain-containing protein [Rhodococcus antarcticus]|uniref:DUF881 domain-containing protein n=1 Tax=Rhodococcus antarcticus TaxID=2987751 RepID=A0ABY6P4E8_9NOCA|nr:DUF881 domain-containing protein [Rhodococcus antarcticus]UZJ26403.1 DUF881 domain-containing protein [Rhodococcus antarcticus]
MSAPADPATAPVRRDPAPSLLTSLLSDQLDPGYAAAARLPGRRPHERAWTVFGALAVGLLLGVAAVLASAAAPDAEQVRSGLLTDVQDAQRTAEDLVSQRGALTDQADAVRSQALAGDAQGRSALQRLRTLQAAAGATAVTGPGLVVTVTDTSTNSSPSGTPGVQRGTVLDRDLQLVVNDLWASGAEAVAVGGVRLEPTSTIRQAGGAMLVDDQPVPSPFVVQAVGPAGRMQTSFVVSDAYLRLSAVAQVYGIGFTVEAADTLDLPAAVTPVVRLAVPEGPP